MKRAKRVISILFVAGLIGMSSLNIFADSANVLFADTFDIAASSAWTVISAGANTARTIVNGQYKLSHAALDSQRIYIPSSMNWQNYAVEADVTIDSVSESAFDIRIGGYYSGSGDQAYELIMRKQADDALMIRTRKNDGTLYTINTQTQYLHDQQHRIRLEYYENACKYYIDDALIFEEKELSRDMGGVRVMAYGGPGAAYLDNFSVAEFSGWQQNLPALMLPFTDTFDTAVSPYWTTVNAGANTSNAVVDGQFKFVHTAIDSQRHFIESSNSWADYTIEADLTIDATSANAFDCRIGGYFNSNSDNAYELILRKQDNNMLMLRVRKNDGTLFTLSANNYLHGQVHHIRMEFYKDTCKYFIDGDLVYQEDSLNRQAGGVCITAYGGPGIAYLDNFHVCQSKQTQIESIRVVGLYGAEIIQPLSVVAGASLDFSQVKLMVTYMSESGFEPELIDIVDEMVFGYNSKICGNQLLTILYGEIETEFQILSEIRSDLINELTTSIQAINPSTLALADKDVIKKLSVLFASLSDLEIRSLKEPVSLRSQLYAGLDKMTELMYPAVASTQIAFRDGFTAVFESQQDQYRYQSGYYGSQQGEITQENGILSVAAQTESLDTVFTLPDIYENVSMLEMDYMLTMENSYVGFIGPINMIGGFQARATSKLSTSGDHPDNSIVIYENTTTRSINGYRKIIASPELAESFGDFVNAWHNLKLIKSSSSWDVYLDDQFIMTYSPEVFNDAGRISIRVTGSAFVDNLLIRGDITPVNEMGGVPLIYTDDFEDETVDAQPSHWVEAAGENKWLVYTVNGNHVYGTNYTTDYTQTWIHAFEKDPVFSGRIMVESSTSSAKFGLLAKMTPDGAYVQCGYDNEKSLWYIESSFGPNFHTQLFYSDDTAAIDFDTWYTLAVTAADHNIDFFVNGVPVITVEANMDHNEYGRCGLFSDGAVLYADDIYLEMPNGTQAFDGIMELTIDDTYNHTRIEIEEVQADNGSLLIASQDYTHHQYVSTDDGVTWTAASGYEALGTSGSYGATIRLKNGTYLKIDNEFTAMTSTNMKNWSYTGQVVPQEDIYDSLNRKVPIIHVNGITEITLENGSNRIIVPVGQRYFYNQTTARDGYTRTYYSDDNAHTWVESDNNIGDVYPGYDETNLNYLIEAKILQCDDGSVRMFFSKNTRGVLCYTESFDYGKTWEGFYEMPNMPCAISSFSIAADSDIPGVWYMVWVNDEPEQRCSIFSRTRLTLMKSADGKNWEFVCDVDRLPRTGIQHPAAAQQVYQILDPSLLITSEYIYVTYGRSVSVGEGSHNNQRARLVRVAKLDSGAGNPGEPGEPGEEEPGEPGEPGDGGEARARGELLSLIQNTGGVIYAGLFSEASAGAYEAALEAAADALADDEAQAEDIGAAREALLGAVRGLEIRGEHGEYAELAALLLGAAELNGGDYTPASWRTLSDAVEGAWSFIRAAIGGASEETGAGESAGAEAGVSAGSYAPLADVSPAIAVWMVAVQEAIAALERLPAGGGSPGSGTPDAISGGVYASGGAIELIEEEMGEGGGAAQAGYYVATGGASRAGTINLRLSYRLADVESAEFSLAAGLAGKATLRVIDEDEGENEGGIVAPKPILPGYRTYSLYILANPDTTLELGAGEALLEAALALKPVAGGKGKVVSLLLTHLDIVYHDAGGEGILAATSISTSVASLAVRVFSRFDVNRDGTVTLVDVDVVRRLLGGAADGGEWATDTMRRCDLDGSGVIDIADLSLAIAKYESTVQ